ncbi:MAG TPA: ABC transporter ATP-binding protein [Verrucomicrobiae bacterium]|nr:ABC transporter ATP-binding protein [Verrucomicrobiae bacterium]
MNQFRRVAQFYSPEKPRIAAALALMFLSVGASLLKPWPLAWIVDSVLGTKPLPSWLESFVANANQASRLGIFAAIILVLHAGQGALQALQNFTSIKAGLNALARVRNELFAKLQTLSLRFYHRADQGDLIYRSTWDTYAFQTLFQQGVITFLNAFLSLIVMVAIMWNVNGRLTLAALMTFPMLLITMAFFGRKMKARSLAAHQADSKVSSLTQQSIASVALTQSSVREREEQTRFNSQAETARQARVTQHGLELFYWLIIAVVFGAGTSALVFLGAREVAATRLTLGEMLIFLAYLAQLYEPLNQLSHVGTTVSDASASAGRVIELLDTAPEVKETSNPQSFPAQPTIELNKACFGYDPKTAVLQDASLRIEAGSSIALIGPSGAGKTTLLQLLPRFYDPDSGVVKIGGIDARELKLDELRKHIAYVQQEPILLPTTVAENIGYGRAGASRAEIETAAGNANADVFIQRLPQGYDTIVGEGAARLSVGEKQRLSLARAFLKNAPILLLDEPTSSLDVETEELVVQSLHELMRGRTTLIVAHRLATIRGVDRIVVLDGGRIVEEGKPEDLLAREGYYARMNLK